MPRHSVKHLRLFGYRVEPDTAAVRWLLHYAGKLDLVEIVELDVREGDILEGEYRKRNLFQNVPLLEVILDHKHPYPAGTKAVSELTPWKQARPCTTTNEEGETIAVLKDRVFTLTEAASITTFLCEHFGISHLWKSRSTFQRCRSFEVTALNELLARRVGSMIVLFILTKPYGTTQEEIASAITAHERELLWSFRQIEDILIDHERAAAFASGLDYSQLLERGASEVAAQEKEFTANTLLQRDTEDDDISRGFTSPALVALTAYIGGQALSIADLAVTSSLQALPYFQSWLPGSLRQRNFPATLRYLERMRSVTGFDATLKPRLAFLKRFRRTPNIVGDDPLIRLHAARLRQIVASAKMQATRVAAAGPPMSGVGFAAVGSNDFQTIAVGRQAAARGFLSPPSGSTCAAPSVQEGDRRSSPIRGEGSHGRSDPRLLPQAHSRVLPAPFSLISPGDGTKDKTENDNRRESMVEKKSAASAKKSRGRPLNPLSDWASRICTAPICMPCTLSEKDEEALRRSQRPKTITHSVDGRRVLASKIVKEPKTEVTNDESVASTHGSAPIDAPALSPCVPPPPSYAASIAAAAHREKAAAAAVAAAHQSNPMTRDVAGMASTDDLMAHVQRQPFRSKTCGARTLAEPRPPSWRHNPYDLSTAVEYGGPPCGQGEHGMRLFRSGAVGMADPMTVAAPRTLQPPPASCGRPDRLHVEHSGPPGQGEPSKYLQEMADPMVAAPPTLQPPPACGLYTRV